MIHAISRVTSSSATARLAARDRQNASVAVSRRAHAIAAAVQHEPEQESLNASARFSITRRPKQHQHLVSGLRSSGPLPSATGDVSDSISLQKKRFDVGRLCWEGAKARLRSRKSPVVRLSDQSELALLRQGHDTRFIDVWTDLLARRKDATLAAETMQSRLDLDPDFYLPGEVLNIFLESAKDFRPAALSTLLATFNRTLQRRKLVQADPVANSLLNRLTIELMMQHICTTAPDLIPACARVTAQALTLLLSSGDRSFVSQEANMMMQILAMPVRQAPFRTSKMQLDAVVDILQFMAEQEPPLLVGAIGYEAFIRIQLRLGRTEAEKEWAALQAQSWPPWKVDRNAMDSRLTPESGWSRAKVAMTRMAEDGFSATPTMRVASIYSGHDLDATPTVQTRAVLPRITKSNVIPEVWRARIAVTRTRKEAWASWLAYGTALKGERPATRVINMMILKLSAPERLTPPSDYDGIQREHQDRYEDFYPGEFTELVPEPASIHLHTFTPTPPPDLPAFFDRLVKDGVEIKKSTVRLLLKHTFIIGHAMKYLRAWRSDMAEALLGPDTTGLGIIPVDIVAGFAKVLTLSGPSRFRSHFDRRLSLIAVPSDLSQDDVRLEITENFQKAVWLLSNHTDARRENSRDWRPVFEALGSTRSTFWYMKGQRDLRSTETIERRYTIPVRRFHQCRARILAWRTAQQCVSIMTQRLMPVDEVSFAYICTAMTRAGEALRWAAYQRGIVNAYRWQGPSLPYESILNEAQLIAQERPQDFLMSVYKGWAGSSSTRGTEVIGNYAPLPPAVVHAWIRAVGSWGDYEALHDLIKWIVEQRIVRYSNDVVADRRHIRRMIIGIAVQLETVDTAELSYTPDEVAGDDQEDLFSNLAQDKLYSLDATGAPKDIRDDVQKLLLECFGSELGAWPSQDEIIRYIRRGKELDIYEQERPVADEQDQSVDEFMR